MMKLPSLQQNYYWTEHARLKMRQYRLSESRVKRILRFPKRREVGVAPKTVAGMQPAGSKKHPYEIWVMWAFVNTRDKSSEKKQSKVKFSLDKKITIISAWRYPGISPVHEPPPIPDDVWEFVRQQNNRQQNK